MSTTLQPKNNCPLDGFNPCRQMDCGWFTQIRGTGPDGKEVDSWGCAVAWMPMLLLENAHQSRQTASSVDSFRNSMIDANERSVQLLKLAQDESVRKALK